MSVTRKNLSQDKSLWTIRIDGVPVVLGSKNNFLNKTDSCLLQIVLEAWLFLICVVAPPPPPPQWGTLQSFIWEGSARWPDPYPFVFQLGRKGTPFVYLFWQERYPFGICIEELCIPFLDP